MKQKVIDVKYRKDSETFPQWMKFEMTVLNEDGSTEIIPAYGKDLQDALSRAAHDIKVEKINKKVSNLPTIVFAIGILGLIGILSVGAVIANNYWVFACGLFLVTVGIAVANRWSIEKNKDKISRK